jgi:PAS domain S-box-containing protein
LRKKAVGMDYVNLLSAGCHTGKESRKRLREKITLLEKIVYCLDAVIFIHDLQTSRHIWTNGNYRRLIGYEEAEIKQLSVEEARELFHPDDMKIIMEGTELLRTKQTEGFSGIYRIRHKEGHWVWMYCNATLCQSNNEGDPEYVLGFAADFTPQIHSEKHLNELIAENRRLVNCIRINCLTSREKEIILLLAEGHNCKEISNFLGITYLTTETHIRNIHSKLGLSHQTALLKFALESGLKS